MKTLVLFCCVCAAWTAAWANDRVGMVEPFDTTEGWVGGADLNRPDERNRPKTMKCEGGRLIVETQLGVLSGISSSFFAARNIAPFPGVSRISKNYGEVDLAKYYFLVARMPVAQGCVSLRINQKETKVLYTTGLHAQDIRELGFSGRTPVALQLILYNGTGRVVMDDIRLVSELTKEEQEALIPDGFEIRPQKLKAGPYQGLEALYDRGRAPFSELLKSETVAGGMGLSEWTVFRDEATRAPISKLTRYPGSDAAMQISADGRWVLIKNALRPGHNDHVCDLQTHRVLALPPGQHEFFSKDGNRTALVSFNRKPPGGRLTVQECDLRTMKVATLVDQEVPELPMGETEFSFSDESNKFVIGMRAHDVVFLVDPDASAANRLRIIKLPQPLKGLRLANKDRFITFANCFTYQMLFYDYEAKQTHLRCQRFGGGHAAAGGGVAFGAYGNVLKLAVPLLDMAEAPSDAIRLHSNYRNSRVEVDYGAVSPDGRWAFQDGVRGDVDRQIVAFDLHEGGNVMPIFFHNTSSVGWDVKPYVRISPDSTKIALYSCDMLGDGDVLMVPFQRPEPPRDITVMRAPTGLAITWKPAAQSAETFGYNVYHSASLAGAFEQLNDAPVAATSFVHPRADGRGVYLVTSVDNSGLESRLPAPAMLGDRPRDDAANLFFEAECCDAVTLPFRRQYDGAAANFAAMRVMPERPEETEGALSFAIPADRLHAAGKRRYHVGLRCRLRSDIYPETKDATLSVALDGRLVASVTANGTCDFEWRFAQTPVELESGKHELRITSRAAGVEVDRVAVCGVEQDFAWAKDPQNAEPELRKNVVARAGQLAVAADGPFAMKLSWSATGRGVAHYSVHASPKPLTELTNATLVGSTDATQFRDTGLRPASALHYCVAAYDSRGRWVATYAGQGKTDPLPAAHTIRLTPKSAKLGPAQELVTEAGRDFVRVKPGASASGPTATVHYDFDLPAAGDYTVWFHNRPQSENRYITCRLDNIPGSFWAERWMLLGERVEMLNLTGRKPTRWYVNRLLLRLPAPRNADGIRGARIAAQDVFPLKAGAHSIELSFVVQDPKSPATDIGELIVTNDLTWQPDDYDPRSQFAREK